VGEGQEIPLRWHCEANGAHRGAAVEALTPPSQPVALSLLTTRSTYQLADSAEASDILLSYDHLMDKAVFEALRLLVDHLESEAAELKGKDGALAADEAMDYSHSDAILEDVCRLVTQ